MLAWITTPISLRCPCLGLNTGLDYNPIPPRCPCFGLNTGLDYNPIPPHCPCLELNAGLDYNPIPPHCPCLGLNTGLDYNPIPLHCLLAWTQRWLGLQPNTSTLPAGLDYNLTTPYSLDSAGMWGFSHQATNKQVITSTVINSVTVLSGFLPVITCTSSLLCYCGDWLPSWSYYEIICHGYPANLYGRPLLWFVKSVYITPKPNTVQSL